MEVRILKRLVERSAKITWGKKKETRLKIESRESTRTRRNLRSREAPRQGRGPDPVGAGRRGCRQTQVEGRGQVNRGCVAANTWKGTMKVRRLSSHYFDIIRTEQ